MSHNCEFVLDVKNNPGIEPEITQCDAPTSIKLNGRWVCPKHYDSIAGDGYLQQEATRRQAYLSGE